MAPQDLQNIPATMREYPNWVVWKKFDRNGQKVGKMPYNPTTGALAKANDPATWGTWDDAVAALQSGAYDGVGFELGESPFFVVDLDHVLTDHGNGRYTIKARDLNIVNTLNTYTEFSPSGTGLHLIGKGNPLPDRDGARSDVLEVYQSRRFITFTGKMKEGYPTQPRDCAASCEEVCRQHIPVAFKDRVTPPPIHRHEAPSTRSVAEVLEKMFNCTVGDKWRRLYEGDTRDYANDHSRADMALAYQAMYWSDGDVDVADQIIRSSGLMRPKWDEQHGDMTFGERTLDRAWTAWHESAHTSVKSACSSASRIDTSQVSHPHQRTTR